MLEVMKCHQCGKLAMIVRDGAGGIICCGQPMERLAETSEKVHAPRIEGEGNRIKVSIPGVDNPMQSDHLIEWIEVFDGPFLHVKGLKRGDTAQAEFTVMKPGVKIRTYCEEHGLCSNRPSKR